MKLSVLVTVKDDPIGLYQLLTGLCVQKGPLEVVVVDASRRPIRINDDWGYFVHVIRMPGCRRGTGYQIAAAYATGDVLCFLGADDVPLAQWAKEIREAFQDPQVDVYQGENVLVGAWPRISHVPFIVDGIDVARPGCNTAYRASSYWKLSGLDSRFQTAEDMDLNLRAVKHGLNFASGPAKVAHQVRPYGGRLRQAYENGKGRARLDAKHGLPAQYRETLKTMTRRPWMIPRFIAGAIGYWRQT